MANCEKLTNLNAWKQEFVSIESQIFDENEESEENILSIDPILKVHDVNAGNMNECIIDIMSSSDEDVDLLNSVCSQMSQSNDDKQQTINKREIIDLT